MKTSDNGIYDRRIITSGGIILGIACLFFLSSLIVEMKNLIDFSCIMEPIFRNSDSRFLQEVWLKYGAQRSIIFLSRVFVSICAALLGRAILYQKNYNQGIAWCICGAFFFLTEIVWGIAISLVYGYQMYVRRKE